MSAILESRQLAAGYGKSRVLHGIDLTLEEGEFCGMIGPNGSGKSTLLRTLTGLIKPEQGKVLLRGQDIKTLTPEILARELAVVSQIPPLYPMSVEDFVFLGRIPHRKGRFQLWETSRDLEICEKAMQMTDVARFRSRDLLQMSGGERQLVMVARALAQEPRILLLDEPTSHLDITHQVGLLDLLRRMKKDLGLTVVMVVHDLNLASEYCEKIVLLSEGRVYTQGAPEKVLTYQTIEAVYKTVVVVEQNPISKRPFVLLVPEESKGLQTKKQLPVTGNQ